MYLCNNFWLAGYTILVWAYFIFSFKLKLTLIFVAIEILFPEFGLSIYKEISGQNYRKTDFNHDKKKIT